MALPITIPYTFANATTSIPLSQLDTDFSTIYTTVNGIGNGTVALANVVITGGVVSNVTLANVSGVSVSAIANGASNVSINTLSGNVTVYTSGVLAATIDTSQNFTANANLTLSGASARFFGDFTNATIATRVAFQTSTANSTTGVYALPSGTSTAASWQATNAADPTNASKILIATNGSTDVQLVSGRNGTGTYLPLSFYTNGSQQAQLDTSGNLAVSNGSISDSKGNVRSLPINSQTSAYVLVATDAGKTISITTGGVTVNASLFSAGDAITIFNNSGSNQTITQGTSVTMYQAGTANTGNRTLAQRGVCTLLCVASNTFTISGAGLS